MIGPFFLRKRNPKSANHPAQQATEGCLFDRWLIALGKEKIRNNIINKGNEGTEKTKRMRVKGETKGFSLKGQMSESVGFAIIVIAITFLIIIYRIFIASGASESLGIISERHEVERLKSGVNAMFFMTEQKSGNTMLNLLGVAAAIRNDVINFGPVIGDVNVSEELTWRMDALFEKDHWRIFVPLSGKTPEIQIVIVVDTSGSMNDDIADMQQNLPRLIEEIKKAGREVQATIYMLGAGKVKCSVFPAELIRCKSISSLDCPGLTSDPATTPAGTSEDWGNGMACAAAWGPIIKSSESGEPIQGWSEGAARVGIVLSDELSGGSECCGTTDCPDQWHSLQNGIKGALENKVIVFSLMADPTNYPPARSCYQKGVLAFYFNEIASKTGGYVVELKDATEVSKSIAEIVGSISVSALTKIDVGSTPPKRVRIRAYDVLVPVPMTGEYVKAYIYQWP